MSDPLLTITDLRVRLPDGADRPYAVEDVSLDLQRNEILCIVGESGSGKSMMARATIGLLPRRLHAESGEIRFRGENLLKADETHLQELRGDAISMIFQEPMTALNPLMTIGEQIDEVLVLHKTLTKSERRARILETLEAVRLPEPEMIINAYPHEISGGQRQRAMIAMALILEPEILIADEPTTALDVTTQAQILHLISELQRARGTGTLFITHDFGVVAEIADKVAVMKDGRLVETGPASDILNRPQHAYTRELIAAVPNLAAHGMTVGTDAETVLNVRDLKKIYRGRRGLFSTSARDVYAVRGVSFELKRGETLGIVGESGSGKSTVARCVVRLTESDGGHIALQGKDLLQLSRSEMMPYRRRIQMVFQDPYGSLNPRLRVGQMIAQGPMIHGVSSAKANDKAAELLELVGLEPSAADRFPHEFSGGQRQRIGVARALALEPQVLVADEPVSALDVSVQAQVLRLLADIRDRFELSMLFITHDLRVAAQVCHSVAVMCEGEIVEYGSTGTLFNDPQHAYTKELLSAVPGKNWDNPLAS
ncbi:MAG: ABC transporter ATP-binding protein [Methyloligellaceae bacterium]